MIYAAWFDLHNDDTIVDHPTAMRVYARLLRNPLIFMHAQDIKAWVMADQMGVRSQSVSNAIDLLVERGYVLDHGRTTNNVRRLTLVMDRAKGSPEITLAPKRTTPTVP